LKKSQPFKSRPSGTTLSLTQQEASTLWNGIRNIIWPRVAEDRLTYKRRADVSELYFHTIANSILSNSAFLTNDSDFLNNTDEIQLELGRVAVALEATLHWAWLHDLLSGAGYEVKVTHAQQVISVHPVEGPAGQRPGP
jgi:hypothetical protein